MRNKIIAALFIIVGILAVGISESGMGESDKFNDYEVRQKSNDIIFSDQNYLLPLEKITLPEKKNDAAEIDLTARAVLVIDNLSGKIIYAKDADKKLPIASLTKLTTALTILELSDKNIYDERAVSSKRIYDLNKTVVISESAIAQEGNSASLVKGEGVKASDLVAAMLIASSNDAAWALAEDVGRSMKDGGDIKDFIQSMNDLAAKEKLHETHYSNPTGIDDKENYSSASDVLHVAQKFMRYYPEVFTLTKTKRIDIASVDGKIIHGIENTDKLLGKVSGIIGGKTGFTDESGESLVLVVQNNSNGATISAAIIGSTDRFGEMEKLVNWAWDSFEWK